MDTIMELERRFDVALKYEGVLFYERIAASLRGDAEVMGPHLDFFFPDAAVLGKAKLTKIQMIVETNFGRTDRVFLRRASVLDARFPDKALRVVTAVLAPAV